VKARTSLHRLVLVKEYHRSEDAGKVVPLLRRLVDSFRKRGGLGSIPGQVTRNLWWGSFYSTTSVSPVNSRSTNCLTLIRHRLLDQ
jgi:hypothetical protein